MSPPLDLDSLRRQYPDMPGWGERVFIELEAIKTKLNSRASWTKEDLLVIAGAIGGTVAALKGAGI